MAKTHALPAELTIYAVGELQPTLARWVGAARGSADFRLDGAAVDQVDAAGVQLLVAFSHALCRKHRRLQLVNASTPLAAACRVLGLPSLLAGHDTPGAAA